MADRHAWNPLRSGNLGDVCGSGLCTPPRLPAFTNLCDRLAAFGSHYQFMRIVEI
jgi:hypothetical protein